MKIMIQIGVVFAVCFLGEIISKMLPIPFPSSVLSMILLFLFLIFNIIKVEHIKEKTEFLLKNMAFFFIPAGVSIIDNLDYIKGSILILLFICFFTLIITFIVTAAAVQITIIIQNKLGGNKNDGTN